LHLLAASGTIRRHEKEVVVETTWNDGRRFSGRVALVTGAGGTLGGAVALGFGREGASVVVGYRRSREAAESVAAEIVAAGGVACAHQLDVTDQASADRFVGQAEEMYGRVDVLVNTAGRLDEADTVRFEHMSADAAAALFAVDVLGAMRMCHAVIPQMRRHGRGAIINFSSTYGNGVNPENAINWVPVTYCAAKGAIRGLTTSLARDIAPEIRVNALAPGPISGNWEQEWGVAPDHVAEAKAMNPMKRFGDPREIAETVLFLASDGAGYINGQVIHVEGGWVPAG
jgi:3-oxoacyl-[acyl-carrier protein] reductase